MRGLAALGAGNFDNMGATLLPVSAEIGSFISRTFLALIERRARGSRGAGQAVSFEEIYYNLPAFGPRWDAHTGAEQLRKANGLSGLTLEELDGSRYECIAHIKRLLAYGVFSANLRRKLSSRGGEAFAATTKL